ncbi:MAG: hypothetical protein ACRDSJ_10995 [Rubrobacteraceae bacterium]
MSWGAGIDARMRAGCGVQRALEARAPERTIILLSLNINLEMLNRIRYDERARPGRSSSFLVTLPPTMLAGGDGSIRGLSNVAPNSLSITRGHRL